MLAETGYGGNPDDSNADRIVVRQRSDMRGADVASSGGGSAYGADGLPNLDAPAAVKNAPDPSQPDLPSAKPGAPDMMRAPAPILPKPTGSIAGAADAQARAMTGLAAAAPSEPSLHQMDADTAPPLSQSEAPTAGPATLKTIRLSSNDPPLSVILELSGPVSFDKNLESNSDGSTATVVLKDVTPDVALQTHLVFDKSIFKDCSISSSSAGTTVTLNTQPVAHFAVVPLEGAAAPADDLHPASRNPENQLRELNDSPRRPIPRRKPPRTTGSPSRAGRGIGERHQNTSSNLMPKNFSTTSAYTFRPQ